MHMIISKAREMKIEIIHRETVKPSSPTPDNLRTYQLSFLDQLVPNIPIPLLLFYHQASTLSEASQLLIKSLSRTLTRFHHFAGRLRDDVSVDCNDAGAEFLITKCDCPLSTVLTDPDFPSLTQFVRDLTQSNNPLLLVKANFFACGGLAIGVCVSHKVADAATLSMFLNSWAAEASKPELEPKLIPDFIAASTFPPIESYVPIVEHFKVSDANEKIKLTRVLFQSTGIEALRSKVRSESSVPNPTRIEAVSALIWKCTIEARSGSSGNNGSYFSHTVNIRKRMSPCLPENSVGSITWPFEAKIATGCQASKVELKDLVVLLRNGIDKFNLIWKSETPAEALKSFVEERASMKDGGSSSRIMTTSWCRYPLYGTDFGWGKPLWMCIPNSLRVKNICVMMDTRDGDGIEVTLLLGEEEMKRFQTNQELLAFATLDPAIII